MRKREGRKTDLLSGGNAVLVRLCVLFLCGGITGSVFVGFFPTEDSVVLADYLGDYLTAVCGGEFSRSAPALFWIRLQEAILVVVLGLNAVGVVGLPLFMGVQGFLLAFSVGAFCLAFGWAGLLPGAAVFGVPALFWCPALLCVCVQGMDSAGTLLRRREWGVACTPLYWLRIAAFCCVMLVCAAVECVVVPVLLRLAANAVF